MARRPSPPARPRPAAGLVAPYTFDRLEQVRILAHPLRLRLLELFAEAPRTTKQAAERLGLPPTRLYHHVAALERVGLVRVRETRPNRGTIEKHYEAVARGFEVDIDRVAPGQAGTRSGARQLAAAGASVLGLRVLDRAGEELAAALDAEAGAGRPLAADLPVAVRVGIHARPRRVKEIRDRLLALVRQLMEEGAAKKRAKGRRGAGGEEAMHAWLTIVLAPAVESAAGAGAGAPEDREAIRAPSRSRPRKRAR